MITIRRERGRSPRVGELSGVRPAGVPKKELKPMRVLRSLLLLPLLLALVIVVAAPRPAAAALSVGISVGVAPPPLPVYDQPPIPGPGYVWVPGYWAWGPIGYYWVPGTWVLPPAIGLYWTPPWWGWSDGAYVFNAGYWGPVVGFYGGIDYGYGYLGHGYEGGYWDHGRFFYNREVNNIRNVNITNVYDRRVRDSARTVNPVSFNGGSGGISARPDPQERAAMNQRHVGPTALQQRNISAARSNRALWASANHGQPAVTATSVPGRFNATSGQRGESTAARSFTTNGHAVGSINGRTTGSAASNIHSSSRGVTTATPHAGAQFAPRVTQHQPTRTLSRGAPGSFGAAPEVTQHQPARTFSRGTPGRFGTAPQVTQHQPARTLSQGSPGRFGAARNTFVQRGPSPGMTRSAPAHFSAAPVMHAPARSISGGGGPRGGGHPAPAAPQKQR